MNTKRTVRLAAASLVWGLGCSEAALKLSEGAVQVSASGIDFPPTYIGYPRRATLEVQNLGRAVLHCELEAGVPFDAPASLELVGAATVEVVFNPVHPGPAEGTLRIRCDASLLEVLLTGVGLTPLTCPASPPCRPVQFDPESGQCVESVLPDGTGCEATSQCLEGTRCLGGECVGSPRSCVDDNVCTRDMCQPSVGCEHIDVSSECLAPTAACKVATCDRKAGCGFGNAPDGTPCGPVDCRTADICLLGACVTVPVPEGTTCTPPTPCQGRGTCHNQECVVPTPQPMVPLWTYSDSEDRRPLFPGAVDSLGNLYFIEIPATQCPAADGGIPDGGSGSDAGAGDGGARGGACLDARFTSLTREGYVRYRAPLQMTRFYGGSSVAIDEPAGRAFLTDGRATVEARRMPDGDAVWSRPDITAGLPVHNPDSQGRAYFSFQPVLGLGTTGKIALGITEGYSSHTAWFLGLDAATGATLWTRTRPGDTYRFIADEAGNVYYTAGICWGPPSETTSLSAAGALRWTRAKEGWLRVVAGGKALFDGSVFNGHPPPVLLDVSSGAEVLRLAEPFDHWYFHSVLFSPKSLTFVDMNGNALSFDPATGTRAWRRHVSTSGYMRYAALTSRGTLLVGACRGGSTECAAGDTYTLSEIAPTGDELYACPLPQGALYGAALHRGRWYARLGASIAAFDAPGLDIASVGWVAELGSLAHDGRPR